MWDELRFVSYLRDKLYAELNINLDLSEKSFIKLFIFEPFIVLQYLYVNQLGVFQYELLKSDLN